MSSPTCAPWLIATGTARPRRPQVVAVVRQPLSAMPRYAGRSQAPGAAAWLAIMPTSSPRYGRRSRAPGPAGWLAITGAADGRQRGRRKGDGGRRPRAGSLDPRPWEVHGVVADVVPVPAHSARGPGGRGGPEPQAAGAGRLHPARRPRHLL